MIVFSIGLCIAIVFSFPVLCLGTAAWYGIRALRRLIGGGAA